MCNAISILFLFNPGVFLLLLLFFLKLLSNCSCFVICDDHSNSKIVFIIFIIISLFDFKYSTASIQLNKNVARSFLGHSRSRKRRNPEEIRECRSECCESSGCSNEEMEECDEEVYGWRTSCSTSKCSTSIASFFYSNR